MKLFSAAQIKNWDSFTIKNEPTTSIDLMERAAIACTDWITERFGITNTFKIFCGKGNNGGDGLAIARLLIQKKLSLSVYIIEPGSEGSADFKTNLQRLKDVSSDVYFLKDISKFPSINKDEIIIDAIFGTGLNKRPSDIFESLINHLNNSGAKIISIDTPGGLYADKSSVANSVMRSCYTLTFQRTKLAFLMAENEPYPGKVVVLDIGLSKEYDKTENAEFELTDKNLISKIYIPRKAFANKGNYGYACLLAGSYGMMGAAILSARACLRSGVGKLSCYICKEG
ncbi:MAG: NAD(P)H-hydrate epimerase, partial [Ginsengibacter sp.]